MPVFIYLVTSGRQAVQTVHAVAAVTGSPLNLCLNCHTSSCDAMYAVHIVSFSTLRMQMESMCCTLLLERRIALHRFKHFLA